MFHFGGIFETLYQNCAPTPINNELYDQAVMMVRELTREATLKRKYLRNDRRWFTGREEVVNFVNSPIIDTFFKKKDVDPKQLCVTSGYLDLLDFFFSQMTQFQINKFLTPKTDLFKLALFHGQLDLAKRIVSRSKKVYLSSEALNDILTSTWRNGRFHCVQWMVKQFPSVQFVMDWRGCWAYENHGEVIPYDWLVSHFGLIDIPPPEAACQYAELGYLLWRGVTEPTRAMLVNSVNNANEDVQDYMFKNYKGKFPSLEEMMKVAIHASWPSKSTEVTRRRLDQIFEMTRGRHLQYPEIESMLYDCFECNNTGVLDYLIWKLKIQIGDYIPNIFAKMYWITFESVQLNFVPGSVIEHIRDRYMITGDLIEYLVDRYRRGGYDTRYDTVIYRLTPQTHFKYLGDLGSRLVERQLNQADERHRGGWIERAQLILDVLEKYEGGFDREQFSEMLTEYENAGRFRKEFQPILQRIYLRTKNS